MITKVFERILRDGSFLGLYTDGMSALHRSGVFEFLRERGRAHVVGNGENPNSMAFQAARSIGYNQALEDLYYFKEKFIDPSSTKGEVKLDFGASDKVIITGDITKEELDAINNNTPVRPHTIDIRNPIIK